MSKLQQNGIALCKKGEELYENYRASLRRGMLCEYNYRDLDGALFVFVAPTLEKCREEKDKWLKSKTDNITL